ncbi:flagellar calcium-binding protein TB-17-like isoform X1 [Dysidea avara]|uniref:flagellar calcium-binding protein TB-17-like isoform X1 n=1 Tax=Dysidea avara TaxID=196820 RepID=UPI003321CC1D
MAATSSTTIDWEKINSSLPIKRDADGRAKRKKMFRDFDPNGNGILSLSEVNKGIRDVLHLDAVFDAKPAIMAAFTAAKASQKSARGKAGDDYIELKEFRFFLLALRQYFEYWVAFNRVDVDHDKRISLVEFMENSKMIEGWVKMPVNEATFNEIDTNKGGHILFDEFAKWAIKKELDLEDDVDLDDEDVA